MPLHAIMADLLKHHLDNVECQFIRRGFSTRNAHMVHIVNLSRLKMVYRS